MWMCKMFKTIVILCLVVCSVTAELCSNSKKDKKCVCKRTTDSELLFPVTVADCSNINLNQFPINGELDSELNYLDVSLNNIQVLSAKSRLNNTVLRRINLSRNQVSNIDGGFFDEVPNLDALDLSYNNLTSIEPNLLKGLHILHNFDLSYNNLTKLPWGVLSSAKELFIVDLSYNPLAEFLNFPGTLKELEITTNLTSISLNNVGFTTLINSFFDGYNKIKHIELADNKMELIPSLPQSIEFVDLSGNKFTFVSAAYLNYKSLKVLKLNRMPSLVNIHHYAFFSLRSLKILYITDCSNLKEFNELVFGSTYHNYDVNPTSIYLARNGLQIINDSYEYFFDVMKNVDLSDNPWHCNCNILWLQKYNTPNSVLDHQKNLRCSTPDDFSDRSIMSLKDHELPKCFPEKFVRTHHRVVVSIMILSMIILLLFILYLLKYTAKKNSNNVGPNSPYNIQVTDD
ncbi:unnamed protein product [Brassicogethes aeneus]|uniref:LRRCT domain-containing protein n=1 Tax=Brassicogethes aeneus TaxID=1431903 RepID=A0A9P0BAG0_BRAAE|nr:unnamed protein product [Brassicogethes aeneus]